MHKIYEEEGVFNIIYQIPQIIYSSLISTLINFILKNLSLSQSYILEIKREKAFKILSTKISNVMKCLKIKFFLYFILSFLFLLIFWYYISCFCVVYTNTQIHLIKDTFISFSLSLLYPFLISLIPGFLRIDSLKDENKNKEIMYKISKILQLI